MIFLIDYDRRSATIRSFRKFSDQDRIKAEQLRLELEILSQPDAEVVLLESESEDTVRRTHARYFETAAELLNREPA